MSPFIFLLVLVTAGCSRAADPSPPGNDGGVYFDGSYRQNFNAATAVLIVVFVCGFFFLAFFSVYFRRCSRDRSAVAPVSAAAAAAAAVASSRGARRGVDPAVIETFPLLTYSAAARIKIGKETLECAVCLSEFSNDESLRMLPRCCHVFHPQCIDTWLEGHVTCPVCRANLSVVVGEDPEASDLPMGGVGSAEDEVAIDLSRMGRSHTVGHVSGGCGDRYTLRLPEHVRREIVVAAGGLRRSASVAVFRSGGEGSLRRGFRGASERWASGILARVSTWRRGEAGQGPVKTTVDGSTRGGMFDYVSSGKDDVHVSSDVLERV